MTIKERKIIAHFLHRCLLQLQALQHQEINPFFYSFFTRDEVIEIISSLFSQEQLEKHRLELKEYHELVELLATDIAILQYYLNKVENSITATPSLSQQEAKKFFDRFGLHTHYLRDKPTDEWDQYDRSNYYSLLFKHGKTKRVFVIFTADLTGRQEYAITTKPSFYFDTHEEAQDALNQMVLEGRYTESELKIMSLWHIQ